jgi:hypothetical protein
VRHTKQAPAIFRDSGERQSTDAPGRRLTDVHDQAVDSSFATQRLKPFQPKISEPLFFIS